MRRRLLARVLVALFALRALVPVGFMPDLDALQTGHVDIVLCTAQGDVPIHLNADGTPARPHKSSGADCPFGMALAKSFVASSSPGLPSGRVPAEAAAPVELLATRLPPPLGPPFGSRAPPVLPV